MRKSNKGYRPLDPLTSKIAYERMVESGALGERMAQVLYLVSQNDGATHGELARDMYSEYGRVLPISACVESPHKRLPELERKGFVRRGEHRMCKDSKNTKQTWWITDLGRGLAKKSR